MSSRIMCCTCGLALNGIVVSYRIEQHEIVSHSEGHGRYLTTDAAVACSTHCLSEYLKNELEGA